MMISLYVACFIEHRDDDFCMKMNAFLSNPQIIAYFLFLRDVLCSLYRFNKLFQTNLPLRHLPHDRVTTLREAVQQGRFNHFIIIRTTYG